MSPNKPFNLHTWINEHRHLMKPPVGNVQVFKDNKDFIVMVVGGPNARRDYHSNAGEEIFYQIEGEITLRLIEEGKPVNYTLGPGDMMLVTGRMAHSPVRPEGTVGLVIERYRHDDEPDGFSWYCDNCGNLLHEEFQLVTDIVNQLPPIMNRFAESKELRTCKNCGEYLQLPGRP
ncbi:MAG: 3-hydroxyanthranilate 3,4-dioxygenase [Bacteroidota bacterium]